jgi:hypothetical protein
MEKMEGALLQTALRALGYEVTVSGTALLFGSRGAYGVHRYENGKLTIATSSLVDGDQSAFVNRIKQAYSTEVVKATAKRFGWALKTDAKQQNKFIATRRG